MKLTPDEIRRLAKLTLATKPEGLSCEDWIQQVGEYVEATSRGDEPSESMRAVEEHALRCPPCMEELEAMRKLIADEESSDLPG